MTESLAHPPATSVRRFDRLKKVGLFLVSPCIALYYAALLPGKLLQLARAELSGAPSSPTAVERK